MSGLRDSWLAEAVFSFRSFREPRAQCRSYLKMSKFPKSHHKIMKITIVERQPPPIFFAP